MRKFKKVNERRIRHLVEALKQSNYYFGASVKNKSTKIDLHFIEAL